jgi:hypothetical protein
LNPEIASVQLIQILHHISHNLKSERQSILILTMSKLLSISPLYRLYRRGFRRCRSSDRSVRPRASGTRSENIGSSQNPKSSRKSPSGQSQRRRM